LGKIETCAARFEVVSTSEVLNFGMKVTQRTGTFQRMIDFSVEQTQSR